MERENWGSRWGFIIAAIGSAIGLGNIWRFPYVAYENGGGAFMVPYIFALLTTGIGFVALEFIIGKTYKGSAPLSFARISRKFEFVGWWQFAVAFVIITYYSVILAWAVSYIGFSFNLSWGTETEAFLYTDYLHLSDAPVAGQFGGLVWPIVVPLIAIWIVTLYFSFRGVKKGLEMLNRFAIPILVILFIIFVVRAVTLPGAVTGLNAFFEPDWSKVADPDVWMAAYSQIFYSLSIAMGIMVTYSSYLPKKSDTTNNAFITGFANSSFELLSGIGIFAAIGFMALQTDTAVGEVAKGGIGLAFIVLPQIINQLPMPSFFGALFFICLFISGVTSLISLIEVCVSALKDKFGWSRHLSVFVVGVSAMIVSLIYATQSGLYYLDVIDHYVNAFGVLATGAVEIILVAWVFRKLNMLGEEANTYSNIRLGWYWKISMGFITPIVLIVILITSLWSDIREIYGGYPLNFALLFGWLPVILALVFGIVFSLGKWKPADLGHDQN